jgi:uncharacterized protein (TIGR03086 family)
MSSPGGESEIARRYRARADVFERKIAAVRPEQWASQSPCAEWKARDVVGHIVFMHGVMLRPLGRELSPAPSVEDDPPAAFRAARADVEAILHDRELAGTEVDWHTGRLKVEEIVDQVVSMDMVLHGWDLSRATGQDDTMDPAELELSLASLSGMDLASLRVPGILGPEVPVPATASLQNRVLGLLGRDPAWMPPTGTRA